MIYGKNAIIAALADGRIVCDPPSTIEAVHIDVHLGQWYYEPNAREDAKAIATADPSWWYVLRDGVQRGGITIPPHGFILAHTEEFIGSTDPSIQPVFHLRSTIARHGVNHPVAGWGDPGYATRWTLELFNATHQPIVLPVGCRIGCISFHDVQGADSTLLYTERYNVAKAKWTPAAMLPRQGNV